jgi:hypothetical protein
VPWVITCPPFHYCQLQACVDDPPTFEINVGVLPEPCRQECVVDGQEGVREVPNYQFVVSDDDDRAPPGPWGPTPFDLCAHEISDFANLPDELRQVRDCGGHIVTIEAQDLLKAVPPSTEHECVPIDAPEPTPLPPPTATPVLPPTATRVPPGPTGPPVIRVWVDGQERDGVLVPSNYPCFSVDWDVQNATRVTRDGKVVDAAGSFRVCPVDMTELSVTYTFIAEGPGGKSPPKEVWIELFGQYE